VERHIPILVKAPIVVVAISVVALVIAGVPVIAFIAPVGPPLQLLFCYSATVCMNIFLKIERK